MIIDKLENAKLYEGMHKYFKEAFDFIRMAVAENTPAGKYEIAGKDIYASVQEYKTEDIKKKMYEGHENYIDIQYIVSGCEEMHVVDIANTTELIPYDPSHDVEFYTRTSDYTKGFVQSGSYAVFFPSDIHMPGVNVGGEVKAVKKIVVKIKK